MRAPNTLQSNGRDGAFQQLNKQILRRQPWAAKHAATDSNSLRIFARTVGRDVVYVKSETNEFPANAIRYFPVCAS